MIKRVGSTDIVKTSTKPFVQRLKHYEVVWKILEHNFLAAQESKEKWIKDHPFPT